MKRTRITWQQILFAILLALFGYCASHCRDQAPPEPSLEGAWQQLIPQHPPWIWQFDNGILTQSVQDFGATLTTLQFTYAVRADTVYIGGDGQNDPRRLVIRYLGNGALEARQLPAGSPGIGFYFILERL